MSCDLVPPRSFVPEITNQMFVIWKYYAINTPLPPPQWLENACKKEQLCVVLPQNFGCLRRVWMRIIRVIK